MNCQICGNPKLPEESTLCERCTLSTFQIFEILEIYLKENPIPIWLANTVQELAWLYKQYPRTMGYFNTALEVVETFLFMGKDLISIDGISEVNYTTLPRDNVLSLLEEALIIERNGDRISPGKLVKKLQEARWEGYQMDTPEMENKLLEMHGILVVALTKSLLRSGNYLPRQPLAIFHMLSGQILASGEKIDPILPDYIIESSTGGLSSRQISRIVRSMAGLGDGKTKIISDITPDYEKPLKDIIIEYCEKMRERYRERERERER